MSIGSPFLLTCGSYISLPYSRYIFHGQNEIDFRDEIVIENNGKKEYNQKDCNGLYLGT
jgi:hypothetical protein